MKETIGDREQWLRAFDVRNAAMDIFRTTAERDGEVHYGPPEQNPIFEHFDMASATSVAGFSVIYANSNLLSACRAGENNEIAMIISNPVNREQSLTAIHFHDGDTIITGFGKTMGFPDPQTILLRGKFQLQNLLDFGSRVILNSYRVKDLGFSAIQGLEPHGFLTMPRTATCALAVTCKRFKGDDGEIDATEVVHNRCDVRAKNGLLLSLPTYANTFLAGR